MQITESKLREVFKEYGDITNVQLKYTPEGKFRKFAFVGFKTNDSADAAIKALDKTFIEGSKLTVEVCARLGEPQQLHQHYSILMEVVDECIKENPGY